MVAIYQAASGPGTVALLASPATWAVISTAIAAERERAISDWGKVARPAIEAALRTAPEGGAVRVTMDADAAIAVLQLAETV